MFEMEPKDGVNSGSLTVRAGATYFLRVRSADKSAVDFTVDLTLA